MSDTQPQVQTSGLTPYLMVGDPGAGVAAEFYKQAFAAVEQLRMAADDGKRFMHIHLRVNGNSLMLSDVFPEHGYGAETPAAITLHLQVDDVDAWYERAVAAGAIAGMPPQDMFWGDRYGQLKDPFGFSWSIGGPAKG
jgi:PhnB protein